MKTNNPQSSENTVDYAERVLRRFEAFLKQPVKKQDLSGYEKKLIESLDDAFEKTQYGEWDLGLLRTFVVWAFIRERRQSFRNGVKAGMSDKKTKRRAS